MGHLSVRGIARKYRNRTGTLRVKDEFFGRVSERESLRRKLEDVARETHSPRFGKFEQVWSHIVVRVELDPDDDLSNATITSLRNTWKTTIEDWWSDNWGAGRRGELTCPFTFEIDWVTRREHHKVRVRSCDDFCRSNMLLWDENDTGAVAAHEFGHMLGHEDEYEDANVPDRDPVNTGTIMDNNSQNFPRRLFTQFARNIGSSVRRT